MKLIENSHRAQIRNELLATFQNEDYQSADSQISTLLDDLYNRIPQNRRISYGRVHTIRILAEAIYDTMQAQEMDILPSIGRLFDRSSEYRVRGVALGILSLYGLESFEEVPRYFEQAASSPHWELREFAQMFFRKLIKKYPWEARSFLLKKVRMDNPYLRRFVSETLRPVVENRWFYQDAEYPLSILRHLFQESDPYPRSSVANNLSDLSRRLPDMILNILEDLANTGDPNSYWIAYRASRNLVKSRPDRVMDLLSVDTYKYKNRVYRRSAG